MASFGLLDKTMTPQNSLSGALTLSTALLVATTTALAQTPPNIVLIFVDDMGINDLGATAYPEVNPYPASGPTPISYSSSYDPLPAPNAAAGLTPNIDSLASDGMRMTSFYAAAPVCTPSRSGMLTGCYPTRVDMEGVIWNSTHDWGLNPSEVTIAERLKQAGYTTALMGKWHVGTFGGSYGMDFHPTHHGFDEFFGLPASNDAWLTTLWDGESEVTGYVTGTGGTLTSPVNTTDEQRHLLEALTEKSIDFINSANATGTPFFLYFASHAPHTPCWPHPDYINASGVSQYYDVVRELDARVGQILDKLDALGIAGNTLVLFTSDNGPWVTRPDPWLPEQTCGSAYPFRGYKRGANEGGPRVPFLARFPGRITAGSVTDELGSAIDLLPTLVNLASGELPVAVIDGVDLWPLLSGASSISPRSEFFYYEENDTSAVGVRQGNNKLLNSSDYSATTGWFDLSTDIQESSSLGANATLSSLISSHNSSLVRRTRATSKSNWIEIDNTTVTVTEGGTATLNVRLHAAANVTLSVGRFSGDSDLSVQSGNSLTFTTGNYNIWQTVTVAAGEDFDLENGGATFRASASGLYLREIFILESDTGSNGPPPPPEPELPATISGLVGWYDAQQFTDADGTAVTTWTDRTEGTNTLAQNLTQYTGASGTPVAPTVQTVLLNGINYRSMRFLAGASGEYEQLKVDNLVSSSNNTRTIITAYKGGVDSPNSRPVGFGSRLVDGSLTKELWNLATDGTYGSSRFDGAFIGPYSATGLTRDEFLLRTSVMESKTSFDEFIDELDPSFTDTQRLSSGTPSASLGTVLGSFHVGDVHNSAVGGGNGAANFDILEILVYDRVLTTQERQGVQAYLVSKYTTDPYPIGQPQVSPVTIDGETYLSLTYRQITGGSGTTGVDYTALGRTYTVEYDTDLTDPWSSGSVVQVGDAIDNGDGTETVTVRLTTPLATDGKQFMRLRVTQ
jgi:arylsulfatase A-like enzyme